MNGCAGILSCSDDAAHCLSLKHLLNWADGVLTVELRLVLGGIVYTDSSPCLFNCGKKTILMHLCIRSKASVLFPFIAESLNYSAASQGLISFLRLHHLVSLGCCSSLLEASWFNAEWHICSLCMRLLFIHLFIDLLSHFLPNQTSYVERCTFGPPPTAAQAPSFHQCVNNG